MPEEKSGESGMQLFKINWTVKQLANGQERFEIKIRADSIEEANRNGIRYIVQPGGSVMDKEVIEMCDASGIAMIFTRRRMFRH